MSRNTRKRPFIFRDTTLTTPRSLARAFNDPKLQKDVEPALRFIAAFEEARAWRPRPNAETFRIGGPFLRLTRMLRPFPIYLVAHWLDGFMWSEEQFGTKESDYWLLATVHHARTGKLDRIRRCAMCQKWIYVREQKQRFCSNACKQKSWRERGRPRHFRDWRGLRARYRITHPEKGGTK